ncbi:Conserved_hypothetical protein [Hexamita inflata]|uniref:Uncharacterized protein n=1 Tax=Hexamita inflata TaxID=28002 RepID=A0AA86QAX0_9EUKA|nr:Conserved hypothetical protein [Hexamita inflata]
MNFQQWLQNLGQSKSRVDTLESLSNLNQIVKAKSIQLPLFQGDEIIHSVITVLSTAVNADEFTMCKALTAHCLQHINFVSIPVVQDLYKFVITQLFSQPEINWQFTNYISILIDIFFKVTTHKFDPRRDQQDIVELNSKKLRLSHLFTLIADTFKARPFNLMHQQLLVLLNSINYESGQIIQNYWLQYFGQHSIVTISLMQGTPAMRSEALKTIQQASNASKKQLKQATCADKILACYLPYHAQADALLFTLKQLQVLLIQFDKFEPEFQLDLLKAFECFMQAISFSNLRFNLSDFVRDFPQKLQLKIQNISLKLLRDELSQLISFRNGDYYYSFINSFCFQIRTTCQLLLKYLKNLDLLNVEVKSSNRFVVVENLDDIKDEELIKLNFELLSNYLALFPNLPVFVQMFPFLEALKIFTEEDDGTTERDTGDTDDTPIQATNLTQQVLDEIVNALYRGNENVQKTNLEILANFTQNYQHGVNLSLGVLSKNPEKQTINFIFLKGLCTKITGKNIKPVQDLFLIRNLNDMYHFIVKSLIIQAKKNQYCASFFSSVYHTPVEILNGLEIDDFLIFYQRCIKEIEYFKTKKITNQLQFIYSKVLYAHQTLIKTDLFQENKLMQDQAVQLIVELINANRTPANNKKPLLQSLGCLIQQNIEITAEILDCVTQQCSKYSRSQSTALRVLTFIMKRMDPILQIKEYTMESFIDLTINSLNEKDTTGYAGVVVMGDFYSIAADLNNNQPIFLQKTKQIHNQILQALSDKMTDFINLYPKTVENTFRAFQIQKYMICVLKTLAKIPFYLTDKVTYNLVKYIYGEFLRLFKTSSQVLQQIEINTQWLIMQVVKNNQHIENGTIKDYLIEYVKEMLEKTQNEIFNVKIIIKGCNEEEALTYKEELEGLEEQQASIAEWEEALKK